MSNIKNKKMLTVAFIMFLAISALIITTIEYGRYKRERQRITYITLTKASNIEYIMKTLLDKTKVLELLVVQGKGYIGNFNESAEKLLDDPSIRSLQLAPDGVITQVYPLNNNEEILGDNLFELPARAKEARAAKESGKLTMSGPYNLDQGGIGIIGRQPIYFTNAQGGKEFWGFSVVVLDLPDAFYAANLNQLNDEGYEYRVQCINSDTQNLQVITQSSEKEFTDPVDVIIKLPNTEWIFSVIPSKGWTNRLLLGIEIVSSILISGLLVLLTHTILILNFQRKELIHLSLTDSLTGLYNRRMLQESLEKKCENGKQPFLFCYMDLNGFKSINDTYGHACGDLFLKACAQRIRSCMKPNDILFRIGGDEFAAIIVSEKKFVECKKRMKQINDKIEEPFLLEEHEIHSSISIGYSLFPNDARQSEQLVKLADESMYQHKMEHKQKLLEQNNKQSDTVKQTK